MYESPIQIMYDEFYKTVSDQLDHKIFQTVVNANITVDRGELLKALAYDRGQYDKGYGDGYQDGKRDAWQWISTKERMPDLNKRVLVCVSIDGKTAVWSDVRWNGKEWETEEEAVYEYWTPIDCPVTHWMPLPQPPKEASDD